MGLWYVRYSQWPLPGLFFIPSLRGTPLESPLFRSATFPLLWPLPQHLPKPAPCLGAVAQPSDTSLGSLVANSPLCLPSGLLRMQEDRPQHGHHKSCPPSCSQSITDQLQSP